MVEQIGGKEALQKLISIAAPDADDSNISLAVHDGVRDISTVFFAEKDMQTAILAALAHRGDNIGKIVKTIADHR